MDQRTVLVIGESLIDVVPRNGIDERIVGGSPANIAFGLGRLGIPVRFLTGIARDVDGDAIAAHLASSGVHLDDASWALDATSVARVELQPDGSARYDFTIDSALPEPQLRGESVVHIGSISAFLAPGADVVEQFIRTLPDDVLVTFDPNIRASLVTDHEAAVARFERLASRCTLVKMSDEDAEWLYPALELPGVLAHVRGLGAALAIITRGGEGALLQSAAADAVARAPKVTVADTIGAGDTFMTALISRLATDLADDLAFDAAALEELGSFAATAAAITVQRTGADLPWRAELDAALAAG